MSDWLAQAADRAPAGFADGMYWALANGLHLIAAAVGTGLLVLALLLAWVLRREPAPPVPEVEDRRWLFDELYAQPAEPRRVREPAGVA